MIMERKFRGGIVLFFLLLACLFLASCDNTKYMISGTWYQQSSDGSTIKWTFTDDGKLTVGGSEYTYEAPERNSFVLYSGSDKLTATMKDNVIHIAEPSGEVALYKAGALPEAERSPDASAPTEEENAAAAPGSGTEASSPVPAPQEEQKQISGTFKSQNGSVTAEFTGTTLTMTSKDGSKTLSTTYDVDYTSSNHIRLIHGREVVDEYDYEITGETLVFKKNGEVVMEYIRQ